MRSNPGYLLKSFLLYLVNGFNRIFENLLDPNKQSFSFNIFGIILGHSEKAGGLKLHFVALFRFKFVDKI